MGPSEGAFRLYAGTRPSDGGSSGAAGTLDYD